MMGDVARYKNILHSLCNGKTVYLKGNVQVSTQCYAFSACKVVDMTDYSFSRIEIYNEDNFIHCSADLLSVMQIKVLVRHVFNSVMSE